MINNDTTVLFYITDDVKLKDIDISPLYSMAKLKKLTMPYLKDRNDFNEFKKLKTLRISRTKVTSQAGIIAAPALSSLSLIYRPHLKSISEINKLDNLSASYLEKYNALRGLAVLEKNRSIEELFLADVNSVERVPAMFALKIIKFCSLFDESIEPLLDSETLQQVDF
ncbi:hypothetical protein [Kosakonia sp. LAM2021]|uniref:hypothetical protein n=1 Tax=Kosakonia sp. LAM2021 TaxID=2800475 RepID=UPI00190B9743|nr:hypothetical protein [Kosakonia sp. LAM2021]